MDRLDRQLLLGRRLGNRLAGERGRDAANDLEQARASGVDDARSAQDVEQLGRALDRVGAA